ncbi:mannan endo-1-4-beta-mannosidase F [Penicillium diatomitis]|uniref:mannan endo-1,4-beta-mannosidase n=1 Tax=Penicillium diatomitis TaxID=2819901 RepID=A0A9X0BT03_9EURO|nr:mannan endo-1-4-beta-mannosidase F [Penicillium diatomitis]KAJ5481176.1 mannan endo-1-4-beta-mannosidase F [Penicillium diatomitis]
MLYSSAIVLLAGLAAAQVAEYGQCGGKGWTGATTCQSPYTCQYQNDWYSQCLPGTGSGSTTTTTTTQLTTTTTSVKSTTTAPPKTTTTTSGPVSTSTVFPHTNGLNFTIDGETSYFAGTNSYWIGFLTNNADVDLVMQHLSSSGLRILRVWGFNDVNNLPGTGTVWFQHLTSSGATINTGADGLQRLDYVVSSAEKHGIKLIINFVNNWSDYGGINAYVNAFGGSATTWYTNTVAQTTYQAYIKAVVSRYISSPAIFAWELANEPRCKGCDTSVIYDWAKATSAYIKGLDPKHMVTLGDEGFGLTTDSDGSYPFSFDEGLDFSKNLAIPTIDFGTLHLYPSSWGTSTDWGNLWIKAHGDACVAAGKPCLLEEYGYPSNHCSIEAPWQATALHTKGIAGDLFWQYGDTLSSGQTSDDGNTIYYGTSDFTCLVTDHVAAI